MSNDNKETLAALKTAVQMEIDGKKYYLRLAATGANEAGRKLFAALAQEEDIHLKKFEQIFKAIEAKQGWPEVNVGDSHSESLDTVFNHKPEGNSGSTSSELESIQKAMQMENKTLDYYLGQAGKAVYPVEKQFYKAIAAQERIHHAVLLDYFEFLKDPAQYFTMKERHSLDGG